MQLQEKKFLFALVQKVINRKLVAPRALPIRRSSVLDVRARRQLLSNSFQTEELFRILRSYIIIKAL